MRLTKVFVSLFSKINLSKSFSVLPHMHAKSKCKRMKKNKANNSIVSCHPKFCCKLIAQLSCLYLNMLMRLTGVPISLFSKINFSKSFSNLHCIHAKPISNNLSMVPCHPKLCGKLTPQLLCLYLYMSMSLTGVLISLFSKINLSKSFSISALHACQVYTLLNDNKQKITDGPFLSKTMWQTHH